MSATTCDAGCAASTVVDRDPVDVGDEHLGALVDQVVDQVASHLADAGDPDPAPGETGLAPHVLGAGPHPLQHAVGGEHRRVAEPAGGLGCDR